MEALTSIMTNPLESVSGLMETFVPAAAVAQPANEPNATFSEDTLRMLMHNLFTGGSRLQQQMLSKYFSPTATFNLNEGLIQLTDRDSLAQLLRGVQLLVGVEPEVLDITSRTDHAVVLLNLHLSYKLLPLTWWKHSRIQVPTTIILTFGPDPEAVIAATDDVIISHKQEMSLMDLLWWNPLWPWINARLWGPVSGKVLSGMVQVEELLLGRFQFYLGNGARYTQALIWTMQDLTQGLATLSNNKAPARQLAVTGSRRAPAPPAASTSAAAPLASAGGAEPPNVAMPGPGGDATAQEAEPGGLKRVVASPAGAAAQPAEVPVAARAATMATPTAAVAGPGTPTQPSSPAR